MKTCSTCKNEKEAHQFRKDKSRVDGLQSYCRDCAKSLQARMYRNNPDKFKAKTEHRRQEKLTFITFLRTSLKCCHCEEDNGACLDFHHADESQKEFSIAHALTRSAAKVKSELLKCIVLCANCHRKHHAGVLDVSKYPTLTPEEIAFF